VRWEAPGVDAAMAWGGWVERIEAGLEAQTRTARLIVRVENPPRGPQTSPRADRLDINMFCRVDVLGKTVHGVFVLPRGAVQPGSFVYLANNDTLTTRKVDVARTTGEEVLILPGGGLVEGDRVLRKPPSRPVPGMAVRAADVDGATAPASRPPATSSPVAGTP